MNEEEQRILGATRILRAAVEEVMAQKQPDRVEDVIGVPTTIPRGNLSPSRYDDAIEHLLLLGAIERDAETDEANQVLSGVVGGPEAFKITQSGIGLLRRVGLL
jgi:hypothetical protein